MRIIDVRPLADGWTVRCEQIGNDLVFRSGRAAERAALRLADRLAAAGVPSEIRIHLKDGTLGGRFFSPAIGGTDSPSIIMHRCLSPTSEPAQDQVDRRANHSSTKLCPTREWR
jgi:hypothetical protein